MKTSPYKHEDYARPSPFNASGFTLVEVLVAIAIFAVLSVMGWQVFHLLLNNRDRNTQHATQLLQLQRGYSQLQRDLTQTVPMAGQLDQQSQAALIIDGEHLEINKSGVFDPLQLGLDLFEHIEYRYDAARQQLLRYRYKHIYRTTGQMPRAETLLSGVTEFQFTIVDPKGEYTAMQAQPRVDSGSQLATLTQLPRGISMTFKHDGQPVRWLFALVKTPKPAVPDAISSTGTTSPAASTAATTTTTSTLTPTPVASQQVSVTGAGP